MNLTDTEWAFLQNVPESDLIDLAVDLDMLAPEKVDGRALIDQCLPYLLERFEREGLPLSKYDRDDLEALASRERDAIARLLGLAGGASVAQILRQGQRVYKTYLKERPGNAVALLVPTLLPVIARLAADRPR